ncbi:MAG: 30S ribosomal protein S7, partial [Clostridia bacterium]
MPRRSGVPKRDVLPDPKFNSTVVTKLINQVMHDGKKGIAESIVYGAFDIAEKKLNQSAINIFTQALENIMPAVEVKARRV